MKLILILFSLLTTTLTFGQIKGAIDKETGDSVWTTATEGIYKKNETSKNSELVLVAVQKRKKYNSIFLAIATKYAEKFQLHKDDRLYIKLINDKAITLRPVIEAIEEFSKSSTGRNSLANYYLSDEDIQLLKENLIKTIKVITRKGDLDYDIEEEFSSVIQRLALSLF